MEKEKEESSWFEFTEEEFKKIKPEVPEIEVEEVGDGDKQEQAEPAGEQAASKTPAPAEDEDEDEAPEEGPRKLTRSQRLKLQRDKERTEKEAALRRAEELEAKLKKFQEDSEVATEKGIESWRNVITERLAGQKAALKKAFDEGDTDALYEAQVQITKLTNELTNLDRQKTRPKSQAAGTDGSDTPPPNTETTPKTRTPNPAVKTLAEKWAGKHAGWFQKDKILTTAAYVLDDELTQEGWDASDPEYWTELDRRLAARFPDIESPAKAKPTQRDPTISPRGSPAAGTKIKVTLTAEEKQMAERMGMSAKEYALYKYKRENAQNAGGYVEF